MATCKCPSQWLKRTWKSWCIHKCMTTNTSDCASVVIWECAQVLLSCIKKIFLVKKRLNVGERLHHWLTTVSRHCCGLFLFPPTIPSAVMEHMQHSILHHVLANSNLFRLIVFFKSSWSSISWGVNVMMGPQRFSLCSLASQDIDLTIIWKSCHSSIIPNFKMWMHSWWR